MTKLRRVSLSVLALSLLVVACGDDAPPPTPLPDGAVDAAVVDAAVVDVAVPDVATPPDSAGPDARLPDAAIVDGAVPDAATAPPDARPPDAATPPDARVPDAGTPTGPFVCDPVHQLGCGPGQKCDLAASGTFACVADGSLGDFRVCNPGQPNACQAGFTCRGTNFGDQRCARLCIPGEDQCRDGEPCSSVRTTSDGHQYRMCATSQVCNPILDDCPDPSKQCTWNLGGFCLAPGIKPDGSLCSSSLDCLRGSACVQTGLGPTRKCFKMCNPGGGAPACGAGVTCTHFADVGPQAVGACGLGG